MHRRVCALTILLSYAFASADAASADPIARLDEMLIGAAVADACDPAFDWDRLRSSAHDVGRQAYEKFLGDLRTEQPNGANTEWEADRALKLRTEEVLGNGKRLVADKGCDDPEIQGRLVKLRREGLSPP